MTKRSFCRRRLVPVVLVALALCGCRSGASEVGAPPSGEAPRREAATPESPVVEKLEGPDGTDVGAVVAGYNARNLGAPAWRRVSMELVTEGAVTRSFSIVNLWQQEGEEVRTLFLLESPKGLAGTNYLLRESVRDGSEMRVNLFLPAGERRVLEVAADNLNEGLLGSDFSYNDMRMLLPVGGVEYRLAGGSVLLGEPTWVLDARPVTERSKQSYKWAVARFYLCRNIPFLMGADYYGPTGEAGGPFKRMRVQSFEQVEGVWTPTRMTTFGVGDRSTTLTLREAHFAQPRFESSMFTSEKLPDLAEVARQGWPPGNAQRR